MRNKISYRHVELEYVSAEDCQVDELRREFMYHFRASSFVNWRQCLAAAQRVLGMLAEVPEATS